MKIKYIVFFWIVFFSLLDARLNYGPVIEEQLKISNLLTEENISQKEKKKLLQLQEDIFVKLFKQILLKRSHFLGIGYYKQYEKEIHLLEQKLRQSIYTENQIEIVKNNIQIASLKIIESAYQTVRSSLRAGSMETPGHFKEMIIAYSKENDERLHSLNLKQFEKYKNDPELTDELRMLAMIYEINKSMVHTLKIHQIGLYKLAHYERMGLLKPAIHIYESELGSRLNPWLKPYNLDITKIVFILISILFVLIIRKLGYILIERVIEKLTFSTNTEIIVDIVKIINFIFMTLAIYIIVEIYYNFQLSQSVVTMIQIFYAAMITFLVYKLANAIADYKIEVYSLNKDLRQEIVNISIKIINVIIFIIGLIIILEIYGADLKTVLSGLGIGGLAIALAARETLSNFFSTISILASNMFSQGEWISVDENEGVIVEIGLRVTTIRTFDNGLITIPNAKLANNEIKNWSRRKLGRRIKLNIGVTYKSKIEDIQNAIKEIETMLSNHPKVASKETSYSTERTRSLVSKEDYIGIKRNIVVVLDTFSESSIDILVYCFSQSTDWLEWLQIKQDIMYEIMLILKKNNLEFAYPTITLDQDTIKSQKKEAV